jgi:hypothetical protein
MTTPNGNIIVINDLALHQVTFTNLAGVVTPAATADIMRVEGQGEYNKATLSNAFGIRSRQAVVQRFEITAATASEILFTAPTVPNVEVVLEFRINSSRQTARFNNNRPSSWIDKSYQITVNSLDTAQTVLAKIYNMFKFGERYGNGHVNVDAVGFFSTGLDVNGAALIAGQLALAATVTQLNLELIDNSSKLEIRAVQGADSLSSNYLTVFKPTLVRDNHEGYNDYRYMTEHVRVRTDESTSRWSIYQDQQIPKGATYAEFRFEILKNRPDVKGMDVWGQKVESTTHATLYLNEQSCEPTIDLVAAFLNQVTLPVAPVFSATVTGTYVNETATLAQFQANV